MRQWTMLTQWLGVACAGMLLLFLVGHQGGMGGQPEAQADSEQEGWNDILAQSHRLDVEYGQCLRLSHTMNWIIHQVECGRWTLPQATRQAVLAVRSTYPRFLAYLAARFRGPTEQATLAHHLVRRVLWDLGEPVLGGRAAAVVSEYRRHFRPGPDALTELGLEAGPGQTDGDGDDRSKRPVPCTQQSLPGLQAKVAAAKRGARPENRRKSLSIQRYADIVDSLTEWHFLCNTVPVMR